ncbi:hypothetical protein ABE218_07475 [Bacillus smithii]|uniref:hypothetical protein n=1 Tax=Bacillus smithii TaxID=1479 RepID=UPI003D22F4EE
MEFARIYVVGSLARFDDDFRHVVDYSDSVSKDAKTIRQTNVYHSAASGYGKSADVRIVSPKICIFTFYSSEKYVASLSSQEILFTRKVPEGFEFLRGGMDSITFLPTGNTNQFGTIAIKYDHQIIQFSFYIGKGRINVKEESL